MNKKTRNEVINTLTGLQYLNAFALEDPKTLEELTVRRLNDEILNATENLTRTQLIHILMNYDNTLERLKEVLGIENYELQE